jgi:hypothetical protein
MCSAPILPSAPNFGAYGKLATLEGNRRFEGRRPLPKPLSEPLSEPLRRTQVGGVSARKTGRRTGVGASDLGSVFQRTPPEKGRAARLGDLPAGRKGAPERLARKGFAGGDFLHARDRLGCREVRPGEA